MWWSLRRDMWHVRSEPGYGWVPASPVGEDARRLALLQCVPPGIEVPGVGYRSTPHTFMVEEKA